MDYQQILINNLKYYRKQNSFSQAKLAELCNVSPGTIGSIESGLIKPSFDLLIVIAENLNISPKDLLVENISTNTNFSKLSLIKINEIKEKINSLFSDEINNIINNK